LRWPILINAFTNSGGPAQPGYKNTFPRLSPQFLTSARTITAAEALISLRLQRLPGLDAQELFEQWRERALALASKLLPCPISDTPILYLYDQIRLCMLFNLNGAAITFCGILVEYALKYTTYAKENPGVPNFDSSAWGAFEEITLVPAIVRARKAGLIDEKHEKSLRSFAKDLRNKYSHFNIQKMRFNDRPVRQHDGINSSSVPPFLNVMSEKRSGSINKESSS
jgi:hypothetical protein